jgi:heme exporter protein CcmD
MDDIGFILGSYVLTFAGVAVLAVWILRRGRRLADRIPEEDKPWT